MRVSGTIVLSVCVCMRAHVCACVVCTCVYILYIVYTYRYSILRSLSKKNTKRHGGTGQVGVTSPVTGNIHSECPVSLSLLSHFVCFSPNALLSPGPLSQVSSSHQHTQRPHLPQLWLPENRGSLLMLQF